MDASSSLLEPATKVDDDMHSILPLQKLAGNVSAWFTGIPKRQAGSSHGIRIRDA